MGTIEKFFNELEQYQSNHYGYYPRQELVDAYTNLPVGIKNLLTPQPKVLNKLWRGCDGLSETRVVSFTSNRGIAHLFGAYVIPFIELSSYDALIDTERARKLKNRLGFKQSISDDEGEVLVIHPKWKRTLNLKDYFVG